MVRISNNINKGPSFTGGLALGPTAASVLGTIGQFSSVQQRAIQGGATLGITAPIDRLNPWTDEKTRKTSAKRTIAKALACTATGVAIRAVTIKIAKHLIVNAKKLPSFIIDTAEGRDYASKVLGTLAALGIMVFTNFLIDVPLTNKLTNIFLKTKNDKDTQKDSKQENNNNNPPATFRCPESTILFKGGAKEC